MRDWRRTTEEIEIYDFPEDCQLAIGEHLEMYNLGSILDNPTMSIKVVSYNLKRGLFSRKPKMVESYLALTPAWLVWTVSTDGRPPTPISAQLVDIHIEDYLESSFFALVEDNGVSVTGKLTGHIGEGGLEQVSMFIGLGEEPAAEEFKEALKEAIQKTRR